MKDEFGRYTMKMVQSKNEAVYYLYTHLRVVQDDEDIETNATKSRDAIPYSCCYGQTLGGFYLRIFLLVHDDR